jgi:transcriptional regulator with XRE-family HTH domain
MTNTDLRRLRRRLGLTQHQLADAIGVRMMTLSRWETGWNPISPLAATALTLYADRAARTNPSTSARPAPTAAAGRRRRRAS